MVVDYVARQLGIADLKGYGGSETLWDHAAEIRRAYGYRDFGEAPAHGQLREWLEADLGDPAGARPLLERALAIAESAHGPDHPTTLTFRANLAGVLRPAVK